MRQRAAEHALAGAESTEAVSDKAPYELWLARLYLTKAREEAGQAHYALARELLATAQQNAVLARQLSLSRPASARAREGLPRDDAAILARTPEDTVRLVAQRAEGAPAPSVDEPVDAARPAHGRGSARVREAAQ